VHLRQLGALDVAAVATHNGRPVPLDAMMLRRRPPPPPVYNPRSPPRLPRVNPDDDPRLAASIPPGGLLHDYLYSHIPTTHTPPIYHLGAILPGFAAEIARRGIRVGATARLPILWTCIVGGSGHGKSTAYRHAIGFVREWQQRILGDAYRDPYLELNGSIPGILTAASAFYRPELDAEVGVFENDEVSKILAQYDSGVAETLCQAYDGREIQRHLRDFQKRKAAGEKVDDILRNPAISANFATTPSALEEVGKNLHMEGGLFARVLWFRDALDVEALMHREIVLAAHRTATLQRWCDWAGWLDGEILMGWDKQVTLAEAAEDCLADYFESYKQKLLNENDRVNSARMRATSTAEVIASLYALSQGSLVIEVEDMQAALALVERCLRTLERLDHTVAVTIDQRLRGRVRAVIDEFPDECPKGILYKRLNVSQKDLDPVLATLIDAGIIERVSPVRPAGQRGRIPEIYRLAKKE